MKNLFTTPNTLIILSLIAFFSSCSSDLDVNAPYKEIPVVYGLLNQNDSVHYVKITKAFLGKADAYDMAMVRDSSEYRDILDVKINEIINGNVSRTFNLERTLIKNKRPGVFYSPDHYVYAFTTPTQALNASAKYKLIAKNKELDTEVSSITDLVNSFTISRPSTSDLATISYSANNNLTDLTIAWVSAINARRYNIFVVFKYFDVDKSSGDPSTYDTIPRTIDWSYDFKSKSSRGGEEMAFKMTGTEFFSKVAEKVPNATPNTERLAHTIDFNFSVAGEELNTYMEVNEPITGVVQEKPEYTNIENGIGIFSSRLDQSIPNKGLSSGTAKYLKNNSLTIEKGFVKYWDVIKNQYLCIDFDPVTATCN
ncbi:MAG: hypothetical protein M3Q58_13395 [Bacteroidota bacterium]|nr:hypothetical protein [Bacteroidota bacterium]